MTTEAFLDKLCADKVPVTIFLMCGIKLQGIITAYDEQGILLRREAHTQLIFKHAVSTVMPVEVVEP